MSGALPENVDFPWNFMVSMTQDGDGRAVGVCLNAVHDQLRVVADLLRALVKQGQTPPSPQPPPFLLTEPLAVDRVFGVGWRQPVDPPVRLEPGWYQFRVDGSQWSLCAADGQVLAGGLVPS